jgi:hypothetical protein
LGHWDKKVAGIVKASQTIPENGDRLFADKWTRRIEGHRAIARQGADHGLLSASIIPDLPAE